MNKPTGRFRPILLAILFALPVLTYGQNRRHHRHQHMHGRSTQVPARPNNATLNIVCSFSDYASIAAEIAGIYGSVQHIAHGEQDPHFVPPKPSYAMLLRVADLWITTGMDLEIWSVTLLDKARNRMIMDGEIGFVSVSDGIELSLIHI